jgi:hypothetical protein
MASAPDRPDPVTFPRHVVPNAPPLPPGPPQIALSVMDSNLAN